MKSQEEYPNLDGGQQAKVQVARRAALKGYV